MCMQIFYPCTLHVKIKQFHQRILSNIQHFSASPLLWLQVQQLSFTRHHTQSCLGLRRWRRKGEPNGLCLEPRPVEPTQQTLPWQQSQLVCLFVLTTGLSFHPSSTQGSLNTKTMYFLLSPSSEFQAGVVDSSYTTKSVSQYTPEYMTNQSELFLRKYFFYGLRMSCLHTMCVTYFGYVHCLFLAFHFLLYLLTTFPSGLHTCMSTGPSPRSWVVLQGLHP